MGFLGPVHYVFIADAFFTATMLSMRTLQSLVEDVWGDRESEMKEPEIESRRTFLTRHNAYKLQAIVALCPLAHMYAVPLETWFSSMFYHPIFISFLVCPFALSLFVPLNQFELGLTLVTVVSFAWFRTDHPWIALALAMQLVASFHSHTSPAILRSRTILTAIFITSNVVAVTTHMLMVIALLFGSSQEAGTLWCSFMTFYTEYKILCTAPFAIHNVLSSPTASNGRLIMPIGWILMDTTIFATQLHTCQPPWFTLGVHTAIILETQTFLFFLPGLLWLWGAKVRQDTTRFALLF